MVNSKSGVGIPYFFIIAALLYRAKQSVISSPIKAAIVNVQHFSRHVGNWKSNCSQYCELFFLDSLAHMNLQKRRL